MDDAAPHRVVCGALVRGVEVLLVHRRADRRHFPDVWDLPGGHVEPGEEPVDALRRELCEEVGVIVHDLDAEPAVRVRVSTELELSTWVVTSWTGEPRNAAPDEHDDLRWWRTAHLDHAMLAGGWVVDTVGLATRR